jgi:hypothetical protein
MLNSFGSLVHHCSLFGVESGAAIAKDKFRIQGSFLTDQGSCSHLYIIQKARISRGFSDILIQPPLTLMIGVKSPPLMKAGPNCSSVRKACAKSYCL